MSLICVTWLQHLLNWVNHEDQDSLLLHNSDSTLKNYYKIFWTPFSCEKGYLDLILVTKFWEKKQSS